VSEIPLERCDYSFCITVVSLKTGNLSLVLQLNDTVYSDFFRKGRMGYPVNADALLAASVIIVLKPEYCCAR
jgi:hypothetical protein